VVNIDGDQYRRPAENPYIPMHKIKKDIKTYFNLDYDFDLLYKGSKILETSSLDENCLDDHTPLVVLRKDIKQVSNRFSEEESKRPPRSSSLPRQTPRATTIHKVLSINNLFEEDIEDETETKAKSSTISNEAYHWKPTTIIYLSPGRSVDDEEINLSLQTSTNNPLSSRSKLLSLNEPIDQTIDEHSHSVPTPPFSTDVQPVYPTILSMNADSRQIIRYSSRSPVRKQTTVKLSLQRNASLTRKKIIERIDSVEIEENLLNTGKYKYNFDY
jgi:hypothetical protein